MDKASLRKKYLEKRKHLSRSQYWALNEKLVDQISQIDWAQFKIVHVFLPISKHYEIDTFSILEYFKEHQPNLEIVIPRTDFKNLSMENVLFDPIHTVLGRNKYDIPEPIHGKIIPPQQIDVILVPLLAFDENGNRVGYGKGFYDRFFSACRPDVQKIGLSFFEPVNQIVGLNEWDIPLDACVTPDKIWKFDSL
ncbi:MAG TPA: 5-formyltetrahydrofolate cyclo-ligase [Daejeonella sp.]|nr:5-formyltetrahydrofolate cyclo-ligase [Daejeonella sp.]